MLNNINHNRWLKSGCKALTLQLTSISICTLIIFSGCKKLVEVHAPATAVTSENVFKSNATAAAVLTGIYTKMSASAYPGDFDISTMSLCLGLSADEFKLWSGIQDNELRGFYLNSLSSNPALPTGSQYWYTLYNRIYTCNAAIEGLNTSSEVNDAVKKQLLGEALFIRALSYYYLVNLYGAVPLALTSDYKINQSLNRTAVPKVFEQVIADLVQAEANLSENYLDAGVLKTTSERTRPTKWVAAALMARVYLHTGEWANAAAQATLVINNTGLFDLAGVALNDVFLANSKEAIWQLQPVTTGNITNTAEGKVFVLPATGPDDAHPVKLSDALLNSFEAGDNRKLLWIGKITLGGSDQYFPAKYKVDAANAPVTEYRMQFRLSELYLIRAEARAQLGNLSEALTDLNTVRHRAGLNDYATADQNALVNKILHERRVELFSESGFRWLDLKRTGTVDAIMQGATLEKGGSWTSTAQLYPIPFTDIQRDPNLSQNPGY